MENQIVSSKQVMLNYGLILGVIGVITNVATYAMGKTYDPHWSVGIISIIIMAIIIFLGIQKFRETNDGLLRLGDAIKIGLGIALIAGIISLIYLFVFSSYIEPDFFKNTLALQEQKWIDIGISDDQIEISKEIANKMSSPIISAAMAIIGSLFLGFIFSLISGLILKKSDEEITSI